ncbi:MAG TPA: class I SAM-dependent methyltransferase [Flavisolibacter sp.]|jgi:SAM-dependent methyltransferase|nr:class I SAM-dependent methyltransferase [Flavisolibacter sp.]
MNTVRIAKFLMTIAQNFPTFNKENVGTLNEVFQHPTFLNGTEEQQKEIMFKSSQSKYENEFAFPFDKYFGFRLLPLLKDKTVLDLGCFSGGRSAAWFERYKLKHISGTDVDQIYMDAAKQFAGIKNIDADFKVGFGEQLPFADNQFDAVLSFDVFEHVRDLEKTMQECYRVLKPGGKLITVFPTYYQPNEHHTGLVTRVPGLQCIFSGKTITKAYYEILEERGEEAYWYKRHSPELENWEKSNTINGITFRRFRRIIKKHNWKILFQGRKPIGSIGRSIEKKKWIKLISFLFIPLTYIPFIQEFMLHRITVILEKK